MRQPGGGAVATRSDAVLFVIPANAGIHFDFAFSSLSHPHPARRFDREPGAGGGPSSEPPHSYVRPVRFVACGALPGSRFRPRREEPPPADQTRLMKAFSPTPCGECFLPFHHAPVTLLRGVVSSPLFESRRGARRIIPRPDVPVLGAGADCFQAPASKKMHLDANSHDKSTIYA